MLDEMILDLSRSGIDLSAVERGGFKPRSSNEIKTFTGVPCSSAGYEIPYFALDGKVMSFSRFRLTKPKAGDFRYLSACGSAHHIYFPNGWLDADASTLVITEGEKKAIAGCLAGIPTLGLAGVDMWHCPSEMGVKRSPEKKLHPELLAALRVREWSRVIIVADSDAKSNGNVRHAMETLARAIRMQAQIKAEFVIIPSALDQAGDEVKMGLDDYLVKGLSYTDLLASSSVPKGGFRPQVPYCTGPQGDPLHYKVPYYYGDEPVFPPVWEEKAVERREKGSEPSLEIQNKPMQDAPAAWYDMTYRVLHVRDGKAIDDDPSLPAEEVDLLKGMTDARRRTTFTLPQERQQEFLEGLGISGDVKKLKKIVAAMKRHSATIQTGIRSPGWVEVHGEQYYVAPGMSIKQNPNAPDCEYLPRADAISERHEAAYVVGGDHVVHQNAARDLLSNSGVAGAVAFAFAGALLKPLSNAGHMPEIGILHYGGSNSSGKGKTTILRTIGGLAGSAAKPGEAGTLIRGWNTTENGLEAPLERANDAFLMLDELGQAPEHTDWKALLYMTANGSGKNRMTKGVTARKNLRWSTSIISTGEMGMYEKLKGAEPPEGILFRVIEFDYQPDIVWDRFTNECGGDQRKIADRIDNAISHLRHNHGFTFNDYVTYAMNHQDALSKYYDNILSHLRTLIPEGATSAFARRAKTMALVITSGYVLSQILNDTTIEATVLQFCVNQLWPAGIQDLLASEPMRAGNVVEGYLAAAIDRIRESRVAGAFLTKKGMLCITPDGVSDISNKINLDIASVKAGLVALGFKYINTQRPGTPKVIKCWNSGVSWLKTSEDDERPF